MGTTKRWGQWLEIYRYTFDVILHIVCDPKTDYFWWFNPSFMCLALWSPLNLSESVSSATFCLKPGQGRPVIQMYIHLIEWVFPLQVLYSCFVGNGWVAGGCWDDYYYYSDEMDYSQKFPAKHQELNQFARSDPTWASKTLMVLYTCYMIFECDD